MTGEVTEEFRTPDVKKQYSIGGVIPVKSKQMGKLSYEINKPIRLTVTIKRYCLSLLIKMTFLL